MFRVSTQLFNIYYIGGLESTYTGLFEEGFKVVPDDQSEYCLNSDTNVHLYIE